MNEATFEARLNAELERIFPSLTKLEVSHQDIFTLHFGHRLITINGKENDKAFGRYDVLIKIEGKPLILFELKRPGKDIFPGDKDQGISYARLLDPMPPLVIISNGHKTEFYTTHDKEPWKYDKNDENALKTLIEHALSVAAAEKDEAIRLLLGQQPNLWTKIIRQLTSEKLAERQGDLKDLTYPLVKNFSLPRKIVRQVADQLKNGEQLIALVGPPLSGKTNIIEQLCAGEFNHLVPLYVDGSSLTYGILLQLANIFARELFYVSTIAEVKNWLLNGLRNPVDGRLLVIIDGWTSNISAQIRADIEEIRDICKGHSVSIVIALDEASYSSLAFVAGRPTMTELGHSFVKLSVESLDDEEFGLAEKYFFEQHKTLFTAGSQHNEEYRYPRILRMEAARYPRTIEKDTVNYIPSVTSMGFLYNARHNFASDLTLQMDFKKLAKAFLVDKASREADPEMSLLVHGRGYVTFETAESELGTDRLNRLLSQGHAEKISYKFRNVLIAPKVPELLSSAASYVLADEAVVLFKAGQKDDAYRYIVHNSSSFPYGDIVAAMAVFEAAKKDEEFLTYIVRKLIEDRPNLGTSPKNFKGLLDLPNVGVLPIHVWGGDLIGNIDPWLILSHLANVPMATEDGSRNIHLEILCEVGSFSNILRRPDSLSSKILKPFHVHEIPGVGTILCHKTGIVEPITQAILNGFYSIPREMIKLCEFSLKHNIWMLCGRLSMAAEQTQTCTDPEVVEASKEVITLLSKGDSLKRMLTNNVCDNKVAPALEKKKISRNAPCPCGSGRKYKKCCMP